MAKQQLTPRQTEIYGIIRDSIVNQQRAPTVREICDATGIKSPNGVMCHLKALERKGWISRKANLARAIQLTDEAGITPSAQIKVCVTGLGKGEPHALQGATLNIGELLIGAHAHVVLNGDFQQHGLTRGCVLVTSSRGHSRLNLNPKTRKIYNKPRTGTTPITMILTPTT